MGFVEPAMNSHEAEVVEMLKGLRAWPDVPRAWLNATIEFMQGFGWVKTPLSGGVYLTDRGERAYAEYSARHPAEGQTPGADSIRSGGPEQ